MHLAGRTVTDGAGAEQPAVPRHPGTGRTALHLAAPERGAEISGMDGGASRTTIGFLYEHATAADTAYRHTWSPGRRRPLGPRPRPAPRDGGGSVSVRAVFAHAPKTLGALALLTVPLPATLAVTGAALVRSLLVPPRRTVADDPRTVLISGGKMTKALALARAFHAAGHRVVLVESAQLPVHRAPLLAGGRRLPRGAGSPARPATSRRCATSWSPRASTSGCRSAARRRAGTTRWRSRCSPSSARCCTPTPRCCASSTTRTASPRPPTRSACPSPRPTG